MAPRNPKARAMLRAYRDSAGHEGDEHDALWSRIEGSLDAGAPPLFAETAAATSPVRWGIVGAVLGLAAVATLTLSLGSFRGEGSPREPSSQAPHGVAAPARPESVKDFDDVGDGDEDHQGVVDEVETPREVGPAAPSPAQAPTVATPRNGRTDPKRGGPARRPSAPAIDTEDSLKAELRLITKARVHLRQGLPARALAVLSSHARSFPSGQMREDRLVLRVEALCAQGKDPQARAEARLLLRAYPESAHAQRLQDPCVALGQ